MTASRQLKPREKYGRLTVIDMAPKKSGKPSYSCKCSCGRIVSVRAENLLRGKTKSCGCLMDDRIHGLTNTRLYYIWGNMKARCLNPKTPCFKYYGGKGVCLCDEWHDFKNFFSWATANGYRDDLTIDRKNSDGDYCPDNCRWISFNKNNRRRAGVYSSSSSGVRGVYFHKATGKWAGAFQYKNKRYHKLFETFEAACVGIENLRIDVKKNQTEGKYHGKRK